MNKIYEGENNLNFLNFYVGDNIAILETYFIDDRSPEYIEEFRDLLVNGCSELKHDKNVEFLQLKIEKENYEKDNFLSNDDRWNVIENNEENDIIILECSIEEAPLCIIEMFCGQYLE